MSVGVVRSLVFHRSSSLRYVPGACLGNEWNMWAAGEETGIGDTAMVMVATATAAKAAAEVAQPGRVSMVVGRRGTGGRGTSRRRGSR